jgi:hypothetical protein
MVSAPFNGATVTMGDGLAIVFGGSSNEHEVPVTFCQQGRTLAQGTATHEQLSHLVHACHNYRSFRDGIVVLGGDLQFHLELDNGVAYIWLRHDCRSLAHTSVSRDTLRYLGEIAEAACNGLKYTSPA